MPRGEPQNEWTEARKGAKTMINTTKSMENTSTALAGKCGETLKNMNRLLADAGCAGCRRIETMLPLVPGSRDDVIFVGLNGVGFYFMRGQRVQMPEPLLEILQNTGVLGDRAHGDGGKNAGR